MRCASRPFPCGRSVFETRGNLRRLTTSAQNCRSCRLFPAPGRHKGQTRAAGSPATAPRRNVMKQKVALISLALIGFVFVFSGSAWANGNHRQGHFYGKPLPHHGYYAGKGPGWRHGPGITRSGFIAVRGIAVGSIDLCIAPSKSMSTTITTATPHTTPATNMKHPAHCRIPDSPFPSVSAAPVDPIQQRHR